MSAAEEAPRPVSLVDLIDRLVEPAEPAPISMLPQTAGWAVVAALLVVVLAWLSWRAFRRWRRNAYRRAALAELDAAGDDPAVIAGIVRRTALAAFPRARVASLSGPDWLRFLDATGGQGRFSEGPGAALSDAPYADRPRDVPGLNVAAAGWIRTHRVDAAP